MSVGIYITCKYYDTKSGDPGLPRRKPDQGVPAARVDSCGGWFWSATRGNQTRPSIPSLKNTDIKKKLKLSP
jgi:hypothetical protein